MNPIIDYTNYIWTLDTVDGPYDMDFLETEIDVENLEHLGLLQLDNRILPFKTFNIREASDDGPNYNWFDISTYTAAIESVLGEEYKTWTVQPKYPKTLDNFFEQVLKELYRVYPFKLAMIGFEISGMYYLENFNKPLKEEPYGRFYVGKDNYNQVCVDNRKHVTVID